MTSMENENIESRGARAGESYFKVFPVNFQCNCSAISARKAKAERRSVGYHCGLSLMVTERQERDKSLVFYFRHFRSRFPYGWDFNRRVTRCIYTV